MAFDDVATLLREAQDLRGMGRLDEASAVYRRILTFSPGHVDGLYQLGAIAHGQGRFDEALRLIALAVIQLPEVAPLHFNQGLALAAQGRSEAAARSYRRAAVLAPDYSDARCNLGNALQSSGDISRAAFQYRTGLAIDPASPRLLYNYALAQSAQDAETAAIQLYRRALAVRPGYIGALCNMGNLLAAQGDNGAASACFRLALAIDPALPDALYNLGNILREMDDKRRAVLSYERALGLDPDLADALYNLGNILQDQGESGAAIPRYERALMARPNHPESLFNLGVALQAAGRRTEAAASLRKAFASQPRLPDVFFCNLGAVFNEVGLTGEAIASFERALAAVSDNPEALNNLGLALNNLGRFSDAIGKYKQALVLDPAAKDPITNSGSAHKSLGALAEALACYERALRCEPGFALAHSNLLFTQLYQPGMTLPQILENARQWNLAHGKVPVKPAAPAEHGRAPRIGFISADFRLHAVGNLVLPAVEALARRGHALSFYYNSQAEDGMTDRFRAAAARWRSVSRLTDTRLAEMIAEDGIDILFDLSGHSGHNRLPALARKPSPLQVTWVGYPATTGLAAIDYLLADFHQVPDQERLFYQEKVIRLPDSYVSYSPPESAPPVLDPPCLENKYITFGSFNENSKIGRDTVKVWARILHAVEWSRMILKSARFGDAAARDRYAGWFAEEGISGDRLTFIGVTTPAGHMAATSTVDIALDSFPYTGGLTTLETLWMGVPVVALAGAGIFGRHATGYLRTAGLPELVARDADHYVSIAVGLAADRDRLLALRHGLRRQMMESPLCDTERFANHFETMIDYIWKRHLAGEKPDSLDIGLPDGRTGYSF